MKRVESPHHSSRRGGAVVAIVIHYTAGGRASGSVRWFCMKESRVSAHFVIGRAGEVWQCVDLSRAAWHAGRGTIEAGGIKSTNPNRYTVGVELANHGPVSRADDAGGWLREAGGAMKPYLGPAPVPGVMFSRGRKIDGFWEPYPQEQIEALKGVLKIIREACGDAAADNILGHHEIAPGRKIDPGPAFPWHEFRKANSES